MNRKSFTTSLLAASMLAAFGAARADTYTVTIPNGAPKCMDEANTQPVGCIPSVPLAQSATSGATTDSGPGVAVLPGERSSSALDIHRGVNGSTDYTAPGAGSSTSNDVRLNGAGAAPPSSSSSSSAMSAR